MVLKINRLAIALLAAIGIFGSVSCISQRTLTTSAPISSSSSKSSSSVTNLSPEPPTPAMPAAVPPSAPPPPIMGFDEAVIFAANNLFSKALLPEGAGKLQIVIDPLIDANTGAQSIATQTMQKKLADIMSASYPRFDLQPFSTLSLARAPLLLIGTLTAVDQDNKNGPGPRAWYRIWLTLIDLHTGKILSKGFARVQLAEVDATPIAFFKDSPAWAPDGATDSYVRSCQGTKVGDPINPAYWEKIIAAAMINDAMTAYNAGRYEEALDLYKGVARSGGGDQLRVYNGIYLASYKLGRKEEAAQAFTQIVDYGIAQKRLAVKFLFRPGSTLFLSDSEISGQYVVWLKQISTRISQRDSCLQVSGHTSRTGPEPMNERLSLVRAQTIFSRIGLTTSTSRRMSTVGKGSSEPISGLGTDDARDAADRRVEFKVIDCSTI